MDMDLRNSVEILRESIDKQSKELAHVSRDTKKLKKLELHRQRDNDARRAGGELEPLHVLRPLPNRPGQVTPAARPTTPDLVAARVASPTSRPTSGGPWDKTAAAWVTTCAELKAKVAHATFGVMTLDWDNVAKRAHMFNTSSPPSMHQLFDDLDTRNVGVLNEEQVRQLLVDDHGFDKEMVESELFWRTFATRGHGLPGSESERRRGSERRMHRDDFLVVWHKMIATKEIELQARKIKWTQNVVAGSPALQKYVEDVASYARKIREMTTWHMERTVRVTAEAGLLHEDDVPESMAKAVLSFAKERAVAEENAAKITQARWRGNQARKALPIRSVTRRRRNSADLISKTSSKDRRSNRANAVKDIRAAKRGRAISMYDNDQGGRADLIDAVVKTVESCTKDETVSGGINEHGAGRDVFYVTFEESLMSHIPEDRDTRNTLSDLLQVDAGKDLVRNFFSAEGVGSAHWPALSRQLAEQDIEVEAASVLAPLQALLQKLPVNKYGKAFCAELDFDDVPIGATGLKLISDRIMCEGEFSESLPTELTAIRFRNARLADTSMRMYMKNGNEEWRPNGAADTKGMTAFSKALGSPCSKIKNVEIKGFVTESGIDAFLPQQDDAADEKTWNHITHQNMVQFDFDLNSSLTPENSRILTDHCTLKTFRATGNSYEGDGIHHIAEALDNPQGKYLTEVSIDATRTSDFEVLELLAAALAHERVEKITVVWMAGAGGELTELAQELLKLSNLDLTDEEYYRLHHCVDFSERQRATFIKEQSDATEMMEQSASSFGHSAGGLGSVRKFMNHTVHHHKKHKKGKKAKKAKKRKVLEEDKPNTMAKQLVIDRSMLCFPISLALKVADICNVVAGSEDRADKVDMLEERAMQFQMIAVKIFDECPNEYVAERVLRGSKVDALLDGKDLFSWMIDLDDRPHQFICSKWSQNYIAKIWVHADLTWAMHDHLYFGLIDENGDPGLSTAPCDWSQELDTDWVPFYIFDLTSLWMICKKLVQTLWMVPSLSMVSTQHLAPGGSEGCCSARKQVAELKLFWSTPKVKYTFHTASWLTYLGFLGYYCCYSHPARRGVWSFSSSTEICVYLYIVAHTMSEIQQVYKKYMADPDNLKGTLCGGNTPFFFNSNFYEGLWTHVSSSSWNGLDAVITFLFLCMLPFRAYLASHACAENPDCYLSHEDQEGFDIYFMVTPAAHIIYNILLSGLVLCSFLRGYVIIISEKVTGVLIIALFKMFDDVFVYAIIQFVLIAGFAFALSALYPSSAGLPWYTIEGSFGATSLAMFGEYDTDDYVSGDTTQSGFGMFFFILYQILTSIMLINLLIAMMSHTYDNVQEESLNTWLVEKASLLQDYTVGIHNPVDLPPFNLFYLPIKVLLKLVTKLVQLVKGAPKINPVGDEEIFRQQDIEAFHSMLQGNQTVHRYCSRQDVTLLRERQRTLMYKIQDDTSRLEEAQKATKAGTASPRVGESKVLISKMWAELKEAYMVEKKIIQEDGLEYTRQIFPKPTMTGVVMHGDGDDSPYDSDFTVERTFPDDEEEVSKLARQALEDGEEPPRKKKSLYQNYLDTLEETNSEEAATEEDVKRLLVGRITDIADQMNKFEETMIAMMAAKS